MTKYEYGAMSSKFSLVAENKLTAYATMCLHYGDDLHLLVIHSPDCKDDRWFSPSGKLDFLHKNTYEILDEIFGGEGCLNKYIADNVDAIRECYKSIKRI